MCGIFGQVNRNSSVDQKLLTICTNAISSRGPDSSGVFVDGNVGLGFRRLAIVDLSETGNQPMRNSDSNLIIIFNGEIYNYLDLKKNLSPDTKFRGTSDTEVILNTYEQKGTSALEELEGMFGLCIYDKRNKKLVLARDHFGKKPLYYYKDENTFVFASEIKAILAVDSVKKKLEIDPLSLNKYLFYGYVPSPHSIFKQIKKINPGTIREFSISTWDFVSEKKIWNLEDIETNNSLKEEEILSKLDVLLESSVKKRLMADVPLGMFLSGGLDSTLVSYYLGKLSPNTKTYTVSYGKNPDIDESKYAKMAADKFGLQNVSCEFDSALVKDTFLEIMNYLDEPMADAGIVPLYFISKQSKKDFTVVLSGDGGDEVFGGYTKYKAQQNIEHLSWMSAFSKPISKYVPESSPFHKLLSSFSLPFEQRQFIFGSGSFLSDEVSKLMINSYPLDSVFEDAKRYNDAFKQSDLINRSLYLDCKIQLPDWYLVKGDRATMANSQEMRNPLLDKHLAEYLFSLPGDWKIRNGVSKYLEKKLLEKHFDKDFVNRPKRGFGIPLDKWIKGELKDVFEEYLFKKNDYFNQEYIHSLYNNHLNDVENNQFKLLRIFAFNYFVEKWL